VLRNLTTTGLVVLLLLPCASRALAEEPAIEAPAAATANVEPQKTPETEPAPAHQRRSLDAERVPPHPRPQLDLERPPSYGAASVDTGKKNSHVDTRWMIIGIGGSVAASSIATGATLMITNYSGSSGRNVGTATLVGGIVGLLFAVVSAALDM
jgi:hypothetical protein